ncbi:hypothetical protein SFOMI_0027 [Sphingobium fuliginis]|uniref:Uncharacterized protein n=1 Tax=Sphingobium fuliginis (strain ATCC 27551) TaxID=336203 RepID=A0A292Z723_SPHSA|nr:hypothetical protein SFOMI_0027 [Sphingobium fuliginis]
MGEVATEAPSCGRQERREGRKGAFDVFEVLIASTVASGA